MDRQIKGVGCYRDAVRSSQKQVVKCFGLKLLSLMLLVKLPWSGRVWALFFLTVLCRTKNPQRPQAHQTQIDILMTLVRVVLRWSVEVMVEEARAHSGVETQRQWSYKAIARTTPVLLGLFSLVVLLCVRLQPDGEIPLNTAAWYAKREARLTDEHNDHKH